MSEAACWLPVDDDDEDNAEEEDEEENWVDNGRSTGTGATLICTCRGGDGGWGGNG